MRDAFYVFYNDHAGEVIAASVLRAIGLIAIGWTLSFLAAAVRARRAELPKAATWLPLVGAVLQAVASLMGTFASASGVSTYLDGPRTVDAASDVTGSSVLVASSFIGLVGQFALAAAFVLICLNALRAGLLTRFMGVVGIFVGVFIIIPLVPLSTLQAFWLVAFAFLLFGVWPGAGVPPAWATGRAEPWPKAPAVERGRGRGRAARRSRRSRGPRRRARRWRAPRGASASAAPRAPESGQLTDTPHRPLMLRVLNEAFVTWDESAATRRRGGRGRPWKQRLYAEIAATSHVARRPRRRRPHPSPPTPRHSGWPHSRSPRSC